MPRRAESADLPAMSEGTMTDPERMIWAAAFSAAVGHGSKDKVAVKMAARAVQRFRDIDVEALPAGEREQVEAMRGAATS
jgi:hypothetical protein